MQLIFKIVYSSYLLVYFYSFIRGDTMGMDNQVLETTPINNNLQRLPVSMANIFKRQGNMVPFCLDGLIRVDNYYLRPDYLVVWRWLSIQNEMTRPISISYTWHDSDGRQRKGFVEYYKLVVTYFNMENEVTLLVYLYFVTV